MASNSSRGRAVGFEGDGADGAVIAPLIGAGAAMEVAGGATGARLSPFGVIGGVVVAGVGGGLGLGADSAKAKVGASASSSEPSMSSNTSSSSACDNATGGAVSGRVQGPTPLDDDDADVDDVVGVVVDVVPSSCSRNLERSTVDIRASRGERAALD